MAEIINNNASTVYSIGGVSGTTTSNTLPVNYESNSGLSIIKTSNANDFVPGDIILYTVTITNTSSSNLTGVRIIDNLGGGNLAYVISSGSLTTSSQTYPVSPIATNPLTFTLQELGSGESMTLVYRAQVIFNLPSNVNQITNSLQGIGYTTTGTITGFDNNTIQKKTDGDFTLTKSSNLTDVVTNQVFNYYLTLTNNTSNPANITRVTDDLPNNFTLSSVSLTQSGGSTTTLDSSDYTLTSGNILTVPSVSGPVITVPANSSTVITLTGYFS